MHSDDINIEGGLLSQKRPLLSGGLCTSFQSLSTSSDSLSMQNRATIEICEAELLLKQTEHCHSKSKGKRPNNPVLGALRCASPRPLCLRFCRSIRLTSSTDLAWVVGCELLDEAGGPLPFTPPHTPATNLFFPYRPSVGQIC